MHVADDLAPHPEYNGSEEDNFVMVREINDMRPKRMMEPKEFPPRARQPLQAGPRHRQVCRIELAGEHAHPCPRMGNAQGIEPAIKFTVGPVRCKEMAANPGRSISEKCQCQVLKAITYRTRHKREDPQLRLRRCNGHGHSAYCCDLQASLKR